MFHFIYTVHKYRLLTSVRSFQSRFCSCKKSARSFQLLAFITKQRGSNSQHQNDWANFKPSMVKNRNLQTRLKLVHPYEKLRCSLWTHCCPGAVGETHTLSVFSINNGALRTVYLSVPVSTSILFNHEGACCLVTSQEAVTFTVIHQQL